MTAGKPAGDFKALPTRPSSEKFTRAEARRRWELLAAGVSVDLNPDLKSWLQDVARKMLEADAIDAGTFGGNVTKSQNARKRVFVEASGMGGKEPDVDPAEVTMWLRFYQVTVERYPDQVAGLSAADFLALNLRWPDNADADNRIAKALKTLPPDVRQEFQAIVRNSRRSRHRK